MAQSQGGGTQSGASIQAAWQSGEGPARELEGEPGWPKEAPGAPVPRWLCPGAALTSPVGTSDTPALGPGRAGEALDSPAPAHTPPSTGLPGALVLANTGGRGWLAL